jgi:hypothetical protein
MDRGRQIVLAADTFCQGSEEERFCAYSRMVGYSEVMAEVALGPGKRGNRKSGSAREAHVQQGVPAQPVDATLSNSLIQQHFPERTDLAGGTRSEPSQGSVPFGSTLVTDFGL